MGEIKVNIELENFADRFLFYEGKMKESEIRKHALTALVDTGAVMTMLPQDVVEKLGLRVVRKGVVKYADERSAPSARSARSPSNLQASLQFAGSLRGKEERNIAGAVTIKIGDRSMDSDCIVGPPASEALIGQLVLEELDLLPDPLRQTLNPRPESPIYPLLNLK